MSHSTHSTGNATIQYKLVGCAIDPILLPGPQTVWSQTYTVPAHHIEVRVTEVGGHDSATIEFEDSPIVKNLRNVNEVKNETSAASEQDTFTGQNGEEAEENTETQMDRDMSLFRFVG